MPGATSEYGFPYPVGSDPLGDGEDEIQNLAEAVEEHIVFHAWETVRKSANETVTSSTAYQNDDDLSFPVEAGAVYVVVFQILWESASGDSGIKAAWNLPSGAVAHGHAFKSSNEAYVAANTIKGVQLGGQWLIAAVGNGVGADWDEPRVIAGTHTIVTDVAGTVTLRWAQSTSHATPTKVFKESFLRVQRVA